MWIIRKIESKVQSATYWNRHLAPIVRVNWVKRTLTAVFLVISFVPIIYVGLPALLLSALFVQAKCFAEIINVAYNYKKLPEIPLFRSLNWYFVIVANYYFCGETIAQHLEVYAEKYRVFANLFRYHRFLSFCWYIVGIVWFINLLRRRVIRQQFSLLAWVHFLCIIIVLQSYMVVQNMFEGLIWGILPACLVFLNDIFAYVFGKAYGNTPLIQLSPKKTLEGFLGGAAGTVLLGTLLGHIFCQYQHLVCPTKFVFSGNNIAMSTECNPSYLFQPIGYDLGLFTLHIYPFLFHVQIMALFASLIAPFGGYCASGFKRAFNMEDFADTIPGHGGVMDRFDCQYLMVTFVNVYISSFVRNFNVERTFGKILYLSDDDQKELYYSLGKTLKFQGLLKDY